MAYTTVRAPTIDLTTGEIVRGGHCYLILKQPTMLVGELITEKVAAEFRKFRAGGRRATSVHALANAKDLRGNDHGTERLFVRRVLNDYKDGWMRLFINGELAELSIMDRVEIAPNSTVQFAIRLPPTPPTEDDLDPYVWKGDERPRYYWQAVRDVDDAKWRVVSVDTETFEAFHIGNFDTVAECYAFFRQGPPIELRGWLGRKE